MSRHMPSESEITDEFNQLANEQLALTQKLQEEEPSDLSAAITTLIDGLERTVHSDPTLSSGQIIENASGDPERASTRGRQPAPR